MSAYITHTIYTDAFPPHTTGVCYALFFSSLGAHGGTAGAISIPITNATESNIEQGSSREK
jgi:hypothetical protein